MPDDEQVTPPPAPRDPRESKHSSVDYGGNSHKQREAQAAQGAEKKIEKVVTNTVIVKKENPKEKFRRWISLLDFGVVGRWFYNELILPESKRVAFRAYRTLSDGGERLIFRDDTMHRRSFPPGQVVRAQHTIYNAPVQRSNPYPTDPHTRAIESRSRERGVSRNNYYITRTKDEAEDVIRQLYDNLETYEMVSVADLLQMLGLEVDFYTDNKWGWFELGRADIRQVPEGYRILLPPPQHL